FMPSPPLLISTSRADYPTLLSCTPTSPYATLYQGFLQPSLPHFSRQIYRALNSHRKTTMAEGVQYAS
ncbi:hypothetical protein U1Q18_039572, partial [Sarracenia purpurea var. burkii]